MSYVLCPMSNAKFCFLLGHDNIAILVRPYVLMSSCPQQQARAAEGCPERKKRLKKRRMNSCQEISIQNS